LKKGVFVLLILLLHHALFAQVDYTFVLEKPPTNNDIIIPIFQTLAAALVTEADTLSVVTYSDNAAYLFSPLPGNTPELIRLAGDKIRSDPSRGAVTSNSILSAIKIADEQAEAWGRPSAVRKLIIITGSQSQGKALKIDKPDAFAGGIYYLALDVPVEPALKDIADEGFSWAVDTKTKKPDDEDYVSLADGILNCIKANNPEFAEIEPNSDLISFTAKGILNKMGKLLVLVKNTSSDQPVLRKDRKSIADLSVSPQKDYSVLQTNAAGRGEFTVENGEIVLIVGWEIFSPQLWVVIGILILIVAGIIGLSRLLYFISTGFKPSLHVTLKWQNDEGEERSFGFNISKFGKNIKKYTFPAGTKISELFDSLNVEKNHAVFDLFSIDFNKGKWLNKGKWVYIRPKEYPDQELSDSDYTPDLTPIPEEIKGSLTRRIEPEYVSIVIEEYRKN